MIRTGLARRRFLQVTGGAGLAAAVGAAAGGQPVAGASTRQAPAPAQAQWPTHCLGSVPSGPQDYQQWINYRRGGWAGADGGWPIALPDGRILWLFGDTFMGDIDANNALVPGYAFVIAVQVQDGACFTPMTGGTVANPSSFFPDVDNLLHWPSGGYVDTSVSPPVVRVVATAVVRGTLGEPRLNRIFTLSLPDLEVIGIDRAPYQIPVGTPNFGATVFHDGNTVYLYGHAGPFSSEEDGGPKPGQVERPGLYLARAPANNLINGPWEFWSTGGWSTNTGDAEPLWGDAPADPVHGTTPGTVVRWGSRYLMTGKMGEGWSFEPHLYAWTADSPSGPWLVVRDGNGQPMDIGRQPEFPQPRWYYGGILVTNVPGTSAQNPMLVFSTNSSGCRPNDPVDPIPCTPDNDATQNVYLYGPHFLRPVGLPPR